MLCTKVEAKWELCFDLYMYKDNVAISEWHFKKQLGYQDYIDATLIKLKMHLAHRDLSLSRKYFLISVHEFKSWTQSVSQ